MSLSSGDESPYEDSYDTADVLEPSVETSSLLARLTGLSSPSTPARAQRSPTCAVLLLDTEGDIFNTNLIEKGELGGLEVANELQDRLIAYCKSRQDFATIDSTLVYCINNSMGRTANICKALNLSEAWRLFTGGINTSARMTFCIDESSKLSQPSAKIQKLLRSYACMPTTGLILLGGLHAGAYADFITYELDPSARAKITLVRTSPRAIACQWSELDLPETTIFEDLFGQMHFANPDASGDGREVRVKKSTVPPEDIFFARVKGKTVPVIDTDAAENDKQEQDPPKQKEDASVVQYSPTVAAESKETASLTSPQRSTNPTLTATAAEIQAALLRFSMGSAPSSSRRASTRTAVTSRDKNKGAIITALPSGPSADTRPRNTKIKLFPVHSRPCIDFYLAPDGCPRGEKCTFDHAYEFSEEEWKVFPAFVKQLVCKRKATGGQCSHGKDCPYGHSCAHTATSCPFREACWFLQAGLPHANEVK